MSTAPLVTEDILFSELTLNLCTLLISACIVKEVEWAVYVVYLNSRSVLYMRFKKLIKNKLQ